MAAGVMVLSKHLKRNGRLPGTVLCWSFRRLYLFGHCRVGDPFSDSYDLFGLTLPYAPGQLACCVAAGENIPPKHTNTKRPAPRYRVVLVIQAPVFFLPCNVRDPSAIEARATTTNTCDWLTLSPLSHRFVCWVCCFSALP